MDDFGGADEAISTIVVAEAGAEAEAGSSLLAAETAETTMDKEGWGATRTGMDEAAAAAEDVFLPPSSSATATESGGTPSKDGDNSTVDDDNDGWEGTSATEEEEDETRRAVDAAAACADSATGNSDCSCAGCSEKRLGGVRRRARIVPDVVEGNR